MFPGTATQMIGAIASPAGVIARRVMFNDTEEALHAHSSWFIVAVVAGEVEDRTLVDRYLLRAGDVVFHRPEVIHRSTVAGGGADLVAIECPPHFFEGLAPLLDGDRATYIPAAALHGLASRLAAEMVRGDSATGQVVEALVAELIARASQSPRAGESAPPHWLETALEHIARTTRRAVTTRELAQMLHVPEREIRRVFRNHVGRRVAELSRDARTSFATYLLASGARSSDIAAELGFYDQSHLTRAFRSRRQGDA